jgi:hypothetical protein
MQGGPRQRAFFADAERELTPDEESEFIKCCFGPNADLAG